MVESSRNLMSLHQYMTVRCFGRDFGDAQAVVCFDVALRVNFALRMLFLDVPLPQIPPRKESVAVEARMLCVAGGCTM